MEKPTLTHILAHDAATWHPSLLPENLGEGQGEASYPSDQWLNRVNTYHVKVHDLGSIISKLKDKVDPNRLVLGGEHQTGIPLFQFLSIVPPSFKPEVAYAYTPGVFQLYEIDPVENPGEALLTLKNEWLYNPFYSIDLSAILE